MAFFALPLPLLNTDAFSPNTRGKYLSLPEGRQFSERARFGGGNLRWLLRCWDRFRALAATPPPSRSSNRPECAAGRRFVSAQACAAKNKISRKETAINARDEIRHVRGFKSSDTISLRVVLRDRAEESGLIGDLCAVAD